MPILAEAVPHARNACTSLDDIIERFRRPALSLARRIVVDEALAEDVVQEVFLAYWRRPSAFDPARGPLASLLMAMVHHKAVDAVRREESRRRREEALRRREGPVPGGGAADVEVATWVGERAQAATVRAALGRLTTVQREAIVLAYWGGYTQSEISARTGAPLGTVKTRVRAGMRKLFEELHAGEAVLAPS